jgi:hypothetical protein
MKYIFHHGLQLMKKRVVVIQYELGNDGLRLNKNLQTRIENYYHMAKYTTGNYIITCFDTTGSRLYSKSVKSLMNGISVGTELVQNEGCNSFIVERVLHNSLEPDFYQKWLPKD